VGALAPDTAAEIWRALDRFEAGATLVVRLADRPSLLAGTLETALALPGGAGGVLPIVAHAGAGIVRVLAPAPAPAELTEWQRALAGAGTALASRRGTLLVRRGAGALSSSLASGATGTGVVWMPGWACSGPGAAPVPGCCGCSVVSGSGSIRQVRWCRGGTWYE
jgi:hypothetical protein